eukprot:gnl/MRDRNA2_/MRDRNA2_88503_c0_seq1.p1 gnl/MRDRNA2_/MRDRNA2_88503_c0~~gnl/MRDRNA2_/MRDRNA2_88503_c0_seq1.p1  ORF type:complete len:566 (-),score=125.92 gnl/MRDRNA2_/MRDRNA2_88503_c0_seq1:168-1694(-)
MPNLNPGLPEMSYEVVRRICIEKNLFADPALNDKLFLNYKGFRHIAGLELYSNCKALYLDNNGITEIEGLDRMTKLISLWLQDNAISHIRNLDRNLGLRQLNLSGNCIKRVENVKHLVELNQLNLANNAITSIAHIQEIKELPALRNFDLSHNSVDETEGVIEFFAELPSLVLLRLNGNPAIQNISHYRKRMVNAMPKLNYLDDRPVFEVEKRSCAAWANGGNEAMHQAKRDFHNQKKQECQVEEDRKQLLTDRRKKAIERLDREQREREEKAAKFADSLSNKSSELEGMTAVQTGEEKAVDEYEQKWEQRLGLYGQEALRAQEEQRQRSEGKGGAAAAMDAIRKADAAKANIRPNSQEVRPGPEAYLERPIREDSASQGLDMDEPPRIKGRAATVTDFKQGIKERDVDSMQSLDMREQAVWSTPWNMGKQRHQSGARMESMDAGNSNADEVVPDVWKMNNARSGAEESEIMEKNMRNSAAAREAERTKKSSSNPVPAVSVSELNDLD